MPSYLVEAYLADSPAALADMRARVHRAAEWDRVRYVRTTFLPADEVVLHLFEAPSEEVVRRAVGRVDLPYERIVEAVEGSLILEGRS